LHNDPLRGLVSSRSERNGFADGAEPMLSRLIEREDAERIGSRDWT
jgi:hypothetical protein